ncbi:hypothetical protein CK203_028634 [Vitis vinifera]|uniref:Uncharacterized protein n=1 Tax=Vitis vinifera TaxID=29760 RepID=A0A438I2I9_VITVI|nr:hypothetical protein CK203_028634 [Vitis vinifera]
MKIVTKRFVLDATKLDALKALGTSYGVQNPTRVEVSTALLYKCAAAASEVSSGSPMSSVLIQLENDFEFHGLVGQLKKGIENFRSNYGKKFTNDELPSIVFGSLRGGSQCFSDSNNPINVYLCSIWCRKGDGIEALMTLKKQDMAIFVHDEELLQFASLNPSILDTN